MGINGCLRCTRDKDASLEVSIADTTPWDSSQNVTVLETGVGEPSLDSRKSSLPVELRWKIWKLC